MILKSVDNVFFNTRDVRSLAGYYSRILGLPIIRETDVPSGTTDNSTFVIWAEISVGDLSMSFRRSEGTTTAHPEFRSFEENPPGSGATIAFRVEDMSSARKELSRRGVPFVGDTFSCTDGRELLSIFRDPWGRLLQLYEPLFREEELASYYPQASANLHQIHIHGRGIRSMQLDVYQEDLTGIQSFYSQVLELEAIAVQEDKIVLGLGNTSIRFSRSASRFLDHSAVRLRPFSGVVPVFLSERFEFAREALASATASLTAFSPWFSDDASEQLVFFFDPDGNLAQIKANCERPW
jgi:catechol 2,3-dioxygenase-like lactoylglutathione lyase family enzyme